MRLTLGTTNCRHQPSISTVPQQTIPRNLPCRPRNSLCRILSRGAIVCTSRRIRRIGETVRIAETGSDASGRGDWAIVAERIGADPTGGIAPEVRLSAKSNGSIWVARSQWPGFNEPCRSFPNSRRTCPSTSLRFSRLLREWPRRPRRPIRFCACGPNPIFSGY